MKRLADLVKLSLVSLSLGAVLMMMAAPAQAANYPYVGNLRPFSAECNYMSRAGYLRALVYDRDGIWLSHHECVAIVIQQKTQAGE